MEESFASVVKVDRALPTRGNAGVTAPARLPPRREPRPRPASAASLTWPNAGHSLYRQRSIGWSDNSASARERLARIRGFCGTDDPAAQRGAGCRFEQKIVLGSYARSGETRL